MMENKKISKEDSKILADYLEISKKESDELEKEFSTNIEKGISSKEAQKRLDENGKNIVVSEKKKGILYFIINSFNDKFILILITLSVINYFVGGKDILGSIIIIAIAIISALIRFFQDYSVYKFNEKLKEKIKTSVNVIRDSKEKEVKVENIVVGDVVKLSAGSLIPADLVIVQSKDLFVNESSFTGESVPVEKLSKNLSQKNEIFSVSNICLMNSSVVSGSATGIVIRTGANTYLGKMSRNVGDKKVSTNFEKGMDKITKMLIRYMLVVSVAVFIIYGGIRYHFEKEKLLEALLFSLSVAVGITPTMLPMIVNVNLTRGTRVLAKKKTLVKNINSIENLGAIDILCTDKTGTLTENNITLQKYIDVNGKEDLSILDFAYMNSYFSTGLKNLVDRAIISYGEKNKERERIKDYIKVDEIPFDYERKRMSVVIKNNKNGEYKIITKGALEEILKICTKVKYDNLVEEITPKMCNDAIEIARKFESDGMQVIALASKEAYRGEKIFNTKDESEMTFIGFVAFLDPPKKDVKETLKKLKSIGISTKILTGDNPYATNNICKLAGIDNSNLLLGTDVDALTDDELQEKVESVSVFARMNPMQKQRVVGAYRKNGHVVGYMGDGVNDAPSLHESDVGICVDNAADIAKESADIILLKKDLNVVYNGAIEGRKVYGNIIKYMKMSLSSDFGDVFSIIISSIFLPFLPLLPIQMLIQDFLFDFSQIAIPYDNVDKDFLQKPKKWNTAGISRFMNVMGITSSLIDMIAFAIFWFIFGYTSKSLDSIAHFQTAWFVECLISETLIIYYIRTKNSFKQSKPSIVLIIGTLITIAGTLLTPILLHKVSSFHFVVLPLKYYLAVLLLIVLYSVLVKIIKKIYIKKYGEWL